MRTKTQQEVICVYYSFRHENINARWLLKEIVFDIVFSGFLHPNLKLPFPVYKHVSSTQKSSHGCQAFTKTGITHLPHQTLSSLRSLFSHPPPVPGMGKASCTNLQPLKWLYSKLFLHRTLQRGKRSRPPRQKLCLPLDFLKRQDRSKQIMSPCGMC